MSSVGIREAYMPNPYKRRTKTESRVTLWVCDSPICTSLGQEYTWLTIFPFHTLFGIMRGHSNTTLNCVHFWPLSPFSLFMQKKIRVNYGLFVLSRLPVSNRTNELLEWPLRPVVEGPYRPSVARWGGQLLWDTTYASLWQLNLWV